MGDRCLHHLTLVNKSVRKWTIEVLTGLKGGGEYGRAQAENELGMSDLSPGAQGDAEIVCMARKLYALSVRAVPALAAATSGLCHSAGASGRKSRNFCLVDQIFYAFSCV